MSTNSNSKKWKDSLLKSSLPLELLVAEALHKNDFYVCGEYDYIRPNENGVNTEFSTDLWAFKFFQKDDINSLVLNLLIECKYNYPGVKWIFTPHINEEDIFIGLISVFQEFCTRRINDDILFELDENLDYCYKGVELHTDNFNPQSISRGLNQLRYAIPYEVKKHYSSQIYCRNEDDLNIDMLCPILVTTSDLYIIKKGLNLDNFIAADSLDDIAYKVDSLVCYQESGVHLEDHINTISKEFYQQHPEIEKRLEVFSKILSDEKFKKYRTASSKFSIDNIFKDSTARILIITFEAFEKCLKEIINIVSEANKTIIKIADLNFVREQSPDIFERTNELLKSFQLPKK